MPLVHLLVAASLLLMGCTVEISFTPNSPLPPGYLSDSQKHAVAKALGETQHLSRQQVLAGSGRDVADIARNRLARAGYRDMVCRQFTVGRPKVLVVRCARHSKLDQYVSDPHAPAFTLRLQPQYAFGVVAPLWVDFEPGTRHRYYPRYR